MINWISDNQQLQDLYQQLKPVTAIAVDTEFIRTNTFYSQLALIQLSDGQDCWLIDALSIDSWQPLKELLEAHEKVLVFHACAEDLEVLSHALSISPENIFDTQIAAGIANVGYSMGYARLVSALLNIELDKPETRSDWLTRPLTEEHEKYAVEDVLYLHQLYQQLSDKLKEQQREQWNMDETDALLHQVDNRNSIQDYYLRVKGAWQLKRESLAALKRLCIWRETTARRRDKPRSRILKDSTLLDIALRLPTQIQQLYGIADFYPKAVKKIGPDVISEVVNSFDDPLPESLPKPLPKAAGTIMKEIRTELGKTAENASIPPELLCNKKELESILRSELEGDIMWPKRLATGWRATLVKPVIERVLERSDIGIGA